MSMCYVVWEQVMKTHEMMRTLESASFSQVGFVLYAPLI